MLFSTVLRRGSVYYCRRVVPLKLRSILDKTEVRVSLKTKDYEEAKRRLRPVSQRIDDLFDKARRGVVVVPTFSRDDYPKNDAEWLGIHSAVEAGRRELLPLLTSSPDNPPLSQVWEKWRDERQPSSKLWNEWSMVLRRFISTSLDGIDMPVREVTKAHVRTFKATLLATPARRKQGLVLSQASVKKNLGALRSVFAWAMANGFLDSNPADGMAALAGPKNGSREKPRLPYSVEDLQRIFAITREPGARHWLPYLALYTGARLEELAQLRVEDVNVEGGIPFLDVHGKVKTKSSVRKIPLHPELLRLGFLQYVEEQRAAGHERVFQESGQDVHGAWSGAFSKWYGRHLRNVVGITDPRLTFYSFRHTMKDAMRAALISDAVQRAILGHAGVGVADSYGLGFPIRVLATELTKVRFDLSAGPRSS
jgi:integrase